jgi:molecular chaperone DnaJ
VSKRDYYAVLGVSRESSDQEIKSAYRKLALKYHPDRNPGDKKAEEHFKECAEAYSVLADPEKRARYDRFGHAAVSGAANGAQGFDPTIFAEFDDIFGSIGDIFGIGGMFGGRRRGGPQRGADLRYDLDITFEQSATGTETSIQIPRQETCETCSGSGAAAGTSPSTCPQCRGTGQLRYQQGFFTVARTCGQCRGSGRVITKPCEKCHGQGTIEQLRKLTVKIPAGIASGQRLRLTGEDPLPGIGQQTRIRPESGDPRRRPPSFRPRRVRECSHGAGNTLHSSDGLINPPVVTVPSPPPGACERRRRPGSCTARTRSGRR